MQESASDQIFDQKNKQKTKTKTKLTNKQTNKNTSQQQNCSHGQLNEWTPLVSEKCPERLANKTGAVFGLWKLGMR